MRCIAIVGAREHPNLRIVSEYVRELAVCRDRGEQIVIVSGGAEGVDTRAHTDATRLGLETIVFGAQDVGAFAGADPIRIELSERNRLIHRNTLIAMYCTQMTLFPEGSKGGCWDAAREARRFKRPVEIRYDNGKLYEYTGGFAKKLKGSWRQEGLFA